MTRCNGIVSGGFHYNIIINDCCCYDLDTQAFWMTVCIIIMLLSTFIESDVFNFMLYIIFPPFQVSKFIDSEVEEISIVLIVSYR